MRRAKFKVSGFFDGEREATVTIEYLSPALAVFRVRPLRRRRTFDLNLADVARGVIFDVTKKEIAEKRKAKAKRRL